MYRTKTKKKLPVILEDNELKRLMAIPNKRYYTGLRNKAIITLMANTGLRVSELVNLKTNHIDLNLGKLRVVCGKYKRDRDLKIPKKTLELLKAWNKRRLKGEYFFNTYKNTKIQRRYLNAMLRRYTRRAGIKKHITPHTLRHTYSTHHYRQFKDLETLRRILGHSDISTTQIYITLANLEVEASMDNYREIVA
ncbi:MAG: tyrosine-type recombinase/integrase [Actinobacteria bacterium]|nr:tyrosine-type recombinase/integrase [Actinomycetota bacterium]